MLCGWQRSAALLHFALRDMSHVAWHVMARLQKFSGFHTRLGRVRMRVNDGPFAAEDACAAAESKDEVQVAAHGVARRLVLPTGQINDCDKTTVVYTTSVLRSRR